MGKNSTKDSLKLSSDVIDVQNRIEHWRKTRKKFSPMPADLWEAAASLAQSYGVLKISRELGVNYRSLKSRVFDASNIDRSDNALSIDFIGLNAFEQVNGSAEHAETILELSNAAGMKLTFRFTGKNNLDVAGVVNVFLNSRT